MSATALLHNIVFHPQLSQYLKLLTTTIGRDKSYRLIQYLARLLAWSALRRGGVDAKESAARWAGLQSGLGSTRKALRLFKPVEHLQSAFGPTSAALQYSPLAPFASQTAQATQIARQISLAGFLFTDMIGWLQNVKFLRLRADTAARINLISQRLWLTGILLSLVSSLASLTKLRAQGRRLSLHASHSSSIGYNEKSTSPPVGSASGSSATEDARAKARTLLKEREVLLTQMLTDSLDAWIPANNLGISRLNDGAIGAIGAVTSWLALRTQWKKAGAAK